MGIDVSVPPFSELLAVLVDNGGETVNMDDTVVVADET